MKKALIQLICFALMALAFVACGVPEGAAQPGSAPTLSPGQSQTAEPTPTPTPAPTATPKPTPTPQPTYNPPPEPELLSYEEYFREERILAFFNFEMGDYAYYDTWKWTVIKPEVFLENEYSLHQIYLENIDEESDQYGIKFLVATPLILYKDTRFSAYQFCAKEEIIYFAQNGTDIYCATLYNLEPELLYVSEKPIVEIYGDMNVVFFYNEDFEVYRLHRPSKTLEYLYTIVPTTKLVEFNPYSNLAFFWVEVPNEPQGERSAWANYYYYHTKKGFITYEDIPLEIKGKISLV